MRDPAPSTREECATQRVVAPYGPAATGVRSLPGHTRRVCAWRRRGQDYHYLRHLRHICYIAQDYHATITKNVGITLGLYAYDTALASTLNGTDISSNATVPDFLYLTNRSLGYNCSDPLRNSDRFFPFTDGAPPVPPSALTQSTYNTYPRYTCPTDDDADGLRVLYPECDELLDCETSGG